MRLLPEEIQVGDVFVSTAVGQWKVIDSQLSSVRIYSERNRVMMWYSRSNCASYNFIHSGKYSNLLPYHDRS